MNQPDDTEDIRDALAEREPIFHRRAFGTTRSALEQMTDPTFWEIGASGRVYQRAEVIETVLARYAHGPEPHDWPCSGFALRALGNDTYLLTYTLHEPGRPTRRSTLWRHEASGWKILFHQGTVIADD